MLEVKSNKIADLKELFYNELSELYTKRELWSIFSKLLSKYTNLTETHILANNSEAVNESTIVKMYQAIKGLKQYKPYQYIINEADFMNEIFFVDENVLIPRNETEELIILAEKEIVNYRGFKNIKDKLINIIDIGTGSGCIAISLKKRIPICSLHAVDVSEEALKIAEKNAKYLNADVKFERFDILANDSFDFNVKFDVVISNPPYVLNSEKKLMHDNVLKFEPSLALFVDDLHPLVFYNSICKFSNKNLLSGGIILFEINENLGSAMKKLLIDYGFQNVRIIKDLFSKDRFCVAIKK